MKRLCVLGGILCIAVFGSPPRSLAENVQLGAAADKQTAEVNDEIHLNVKITGVRGAIQAPQLPPLEGFEVFYSGRSSRFSFVNGRSESLTEFNYVLIPRSVGRFILRPIEVKVEGKSYYTNQLDFTIENAQTTAATPAASGPPAPQLTTPSYVPRAAPAVQAAPFVPPQAASSVSDEALDQNIFLKVSPFPAAVYTNQQLILTYSLYTRYDTRYEGFIEEPETSGFWIEEFPMDQNLGRDTEIIDGRKYVRADVKKIALFPTAPGQYQIKPGVIKASVQIEERASSLFDEFFNDSFFSGAGFLGRRVEKHLAPPPIRVEVRPLPEAGKPDSFKGAVGEFRMATNVDKRVVNQNEALTFQVTLEGQGNIETLVAPKLPEIPDVKLYESDTQTQLFRAQNVIAGKKSFEIVMIPTEPGELTIPGVEFSFFNPRTERYVILKSDSYRIKVNPSSVPAPAVPKGILESGLEEGKKEIRLESEDIQYIKEEQAPSGQFRPSKIVVWFVVVNGILTLISAGLAFMRKRSEYLDRNVSLKRTLFAKRYAVKGLKRLDRLVKSSMKDPKSDEIFFDESAKILNRYLSDKLDLSPHGLIQNVVEERLQALQAEPGTIEKVRGCHEICDRVRFGKMDLQGADRRLMIQNIREIIYALERK